MAGQYYECARCGRPDGGSGFYVVDDAGATLFGPGCIACCEAAADEVITI